MLRYTLAGRRRDMGLGAYPAVGLAEARALAEDARKLIRRGVDPLAARDAARAEAIAAAAAQARRAVTFADAARAAVDAKRGGWSNPKHAAQWLATLEAHAFPVIGATPVAEVDMAAVLAVLRPIWEDIPETASRLRQRIEAVLDLARVRGWREGENPARWRGLLQQELPPPRRVKRVEHRPALPWEALPAFWGALAQVDGMGAAALRFVILTAARTGEARLATWREIDLEAAVWTVPAERMKARRLHRVPLSAEALAVLRAVAPARRDSGALIFPSARPGAPISDMTISAVVRRMNEPAPGADPEAPPRWRDRDGRAVVPHGFRASFKAWSLAAGWPDSLSEIAMAHADRDKVRAAYAREDQLEQRRAMMGAWSAAVSSCESQAAGRRITGIL